MQHPEHGAILQAADPGYLHQKDEWYILDAQPDKFMLVYYTGARAYKCQQQHPPVHHVTDIVAS